MEQGQPAETPMSMAERIGGESGLGVLAREVMRQGSILTESQSHVLKPALQAVAFEMIEDPNSSAVINAIYDLRKAIKDMLGFGRHEAQIICRACVNEMNHAIGLETGRSQGVRKVS